MLRIFLALGALTPLLSAQGGTGAAPPISITGVVQASGASICPTLVTHGLACTDVKLSSQNIDLDALVGKLVQLKGKQAALGGVVCPTIEVQAVNPNPPAVLEMCGTPALGCPTRFTICPGGMSLGAFMLSADPGYLPISSEIGTFLLSSNFSILFQDGPNAPCHEMNITVPNNLNLIGEDFWLQGLRVDIGPVGPIHLTNAVCLTILPPLVPCMQPNC